MAGVTVKVQVQEGVCCFCSQDIGGLRQLVFK